MKKIFEIARYLGLDKGLAYVTVGNLVYTALGAVLWFYLASWLNAADYGQINYEISVASILTAIGLLGFDTTLTTFVAKGVYKMVGQATLLVLITSLVLSLFVYAIISSLSLILLLLGMIFFTLVTSELLGRHSFKEFMILLLVQRTLTLVLVPLLFLGYGVDGAIMGFAIAHLVLCYRLIKNFRHLSFSLSTIRPIRNYFFHSFGLGVAKVIPYFSDKLIILPLFGLAVVGYYQLGIQMLTITSIIPVILYNYLLPKEARGGSENSRKTERLGIISAIIMTVALMASMPTVIGHLFPSFVSAIISAQIILLAGIPLALTAIYNSAFMASGKSSHVIIAAGIFLGAQYLLIITLGQIYGLNGLSMSMVIASALQCTYLCLKRRTIRGTSLGSVDRITTLPGQP